MSHTILLKIILKVTNFKVRASANITKVNDNIVIQDPGSQLDFMHIFNIKQRLEMSQDIELLKEWHLLV